MDGRIEATKILFEAGKIRTLADLFKYHPHSPVARYLGTNPQRLQRLTKEPWSLRLIEIVRIAQYFEIDEYQLSQIIIKQAPKKVKK